jgi:hypothetical protein
VNTSIQYHETSEEVGLFECNQFLPESLKAQLR